MLLRSPINTHEPSSFLVHHALSADWRPCWRLLIVHANNLSLAATPTNSCTGALGAISPRGVGHGRFTGAQVRGRCSPKILGRRSFLVAPGESARPRR